MQVSDYINNNAELISALSLFLGFASIVIALVIYRASKPLKRIGFSTRTFRIISNKAKNIDGLSVNYKSEPIDTLSVTRLGFWNEGNEELREADIPENLPPYIGINSGVKIFNISILEQTSEANGIEITQNGGNKGIAIHFKYLNPSDGAILDITHSGTGIDDIYLAGELIGGKIRKASSSPETITTSADPHGATTITRTESGRSNNLAISLIALVIGGGGGLTWSFFEIFPGILLCIGSCLFSTFLYWDARRRYPPSRLRTFDDNIAG